MAEIVSQSKYAAENPLKSSQTLGAAYAYLGVDGAMPLFHGSQGCTAFALVLFVRHFKEAIPLQTTAMDEVATILGGADHLEEAILNIKNRSKPKLIGLCTTALVETRGEDFAGDLARIRKKRAAELEGTEVVFASTPDFEGSIEEGWARAVTAMIETITLETIAPRDRQKIAILAGSNLTVADIEDLRDSAEAFSLTPVILPDISGALDGTVPDRWIPTTYGGTTVEDIRDLGTCAHVIAVGEHMRGPAEALKRRTGLDYTLFRQLTGLKAADRFIQLLATLSGQKVPAKIRRRRAQLQDALLDGHFFFSGKKIAIAAEPDLLYQFSTFFLGMGAEIVTAVTTTGTSKILPHMPVEVVKVGDLSDFEDMAGVAGADLLVTHSHGRQASARLHLPLMRVGFPVFDRLGSQHRKTILYEGARNLIFEAANIFQAVDHHATPEDLNPFLKREQDHDSHRPPSLARH
ncbi:nitrogenase iron-molybdenum cofactor biosynthesis protein NifN [Martelella alba]|uniref:Nitrogenase iron-molybdenum cofactor biosynthesis protein NifN n=1 Tax=Martelella alba TaxID=2590451 RepID=A0A506U6D0_9HYPH|nr:nitrogenase iron-molybdenum cofactor biosynthesis protein NifN [Martelella alba]TPW28525.1 nitrogenase iron-molybdenum cofactor biosynthesis protein NifN [Martelella alba]